MQNSCFFALFLWLIGAHCSWAQQTSLSFDRLNLDEGLSQGTIHCILQDEKGLLWIGTQDGLNKFDGYSFTVFRYDNQDSLSISDNWITCLYEDKMGYLWIGTLSGGVNRYDRSTGTFKQFRQDDTSSNLPSDKIRYIFEDSSGFLWVASDYGLSKKTKNGFSNYRIAGGQNGEIVINHLFEMKNMILAGTNKGFYQFDPKQETLIKNVITGIPEFDIRATLELEPGKILIGGYPGLYQIDLSGTGWSSREIKFPQIKDNLVNSLERDQNGRIWVGYETEGIILWDSGKNTISMRYQPDQTRSLTNDKVYDILYGKFGNIWIGTINGINKYNISNLKFELYQNEPGVIGHNGNSIFSITTDQNSCIWTATRGGLFRIEPVDGVATKFNRSSIPALQDNSFRTVFLDSKGLMWIASNSGTLDLLNPETMDVRSITLNSPNNPNPIYSIFENKQGDFYLGAANGLYRRKRDQQTFWHYPLEEIRSIDEDSHGNLWLGTLGAGIYKFTPDQQQFRQFRHNPDDPQSLSHDIVACIYIDPSDTLWVGTASGFNKFHDNSGVFNNYNINHGLPGEVVYGILPDKDNHLWLSTNNGLTRYNRTDETFRTYHTSDGLQGSEFNAGAYFSTDQGRLYFGGLNGVNTFIPGEIKDHPLLPEVILTGFTVLNEKRAVGQSLESVNQINLTYKDYFFSLEFSAIHLAAPERNRYAYMMEGFDRNWVYTNRRFASYTNLDAGEYTFKVKASNNDGVWNHQELTVNIQIAPPFWRTWWFYLSVALLIGGVLYLIYRQRIAQIRKQEQLKTEFNRKISEVEMKALRSQMNPHFLFNCLNSINRYIVKSDPDTASGYLTKFSRLIRLILQNSKSASIPLTNELEALRLYIEMEELRFENKFDHQIQLEPQLESDYIELPPMMIQPYVENAIWHGLMHKPEKGMLQVVIYKEDNCLICIVQDNGIGRKRAQELKTKSATRNKSMGMKITRDRLAILNNLYQKKSLVEVEDLTDDQGKPAGTKVTLKIPIEIESWEIQSM